jgi:arabinogalactan endo-1,4-beta-galactosidase
MHMDSSMQKESWKESMDGRRREGAMRGLVGVALGAVMAVMSGCSGCGTLTEEPGVVDSTATVTVAPFYKGVTMTFASYLEDVGGHVYKENGVAKDPYQSVKDHGGNMVRLQLEPELFARTPGMEATNAPDVDWQVMSRLKKNMLRAKAAGLDVVLTLKHEKYIPQCWANITNREELGDTLYAWCYRSLLALYNQGTVPAIVTMGNEIDAWFMVPADYMDSANEQFDYAGNVYFLNKGLAAVRQFNADKGTNIRTACHLSSPEHIQWWFSEHYDKGLTDFDILALSWYPGWHSMGNWKNFAEVVSWLKSKGKDMLLLETSYPYTLQNIDSQANAYNANLWPNGTTSAAIQRTTLKNLALELQQAGAIGMITWGNESLPTDIYIYANDEWGKGSTWENNSYWDANCNLHEGIDWMNDVK